MYFILCAGFKERTLVHRQPVTVLHLPTVAACVARCCSVRECLSSMADSNACCCDLGKFGPGSFAIYINQGLYCKIQEISSYD